MTCDRPTDRPPLTVAAENATENGGGDEASPHFDHVIPELVARKVAGPEKATLDDTDVAFHEAEVARLRRELETAGASSSLAEEPTAREALHDLLLRVRLGNA